MERCKFFLAYKGFKQKEETLNTYENIAHIFETILKKRTSLRNHKAFVYYDNWIEDCIHDPLDFQNPIFNRRDMLCRLIYVYMSKNEIQYALHIFIYLIHHYSPKTSMVWRIGFHILSRIGDLVTMYNFFDAMLDNNIWDPSNMFYEFFLYLLDVGEYEKLREIYNDSFPKINRVKRNQREKEMFHVHQLIKLVVGVSFYCTWKESLISGNEDSVSRTQSALELRELYNVIEKNVVVDSYLLNYIDILEHEYKYDEALEILLLYNEKIGTNNSLRFLLQFISKRRNDLPQVSDEMISNLRAPFVVDQIEMDPGSKDMFLLRQFKTHIEYLSEQGQHDDVIHILFGYLCDSRWTSVEWPWKMLFKSVQTLGVESAAVQRSWEYVSDQWKDTYFKCPQNDHIKWLSNILL